MDATKAATDVLNYSNAAIASLLAWAPNLLGALALIVAGYFIASWAQRGLEKAFKRTRRVDPTLAPVIGATIRYSIFIVVAIAALGQLGVATTSLLAALGAAGLAIGLALQGTLQNIAAGIMILWLRPFRVGEYVDNGTIAGTVREVGLFATLLDTYDGIFRFVPNSDLWSGPDLELQRNATRMTDVAIGISYDSDIERARADPARSRGERAARVGTFPSRWYLLTTSATAPLSSATAYGSAPTTSGRFSARWSRKPSVGSTRRASRFRSPSASCTCRRQRQRPPDRFQKDDGRAQGRGRLSLDLPSAPARAGAGASRRAC